MHIGKVYRIILLCVKRLWFFSIEHTSNVDLNQNRESLNAIINIFSFYFSNVINFK